MFAVFQPIRNRLAQLIALLSMVWLAACDPSAFPTAGGGGRPFDASEPVQVALLVPKSDPGASSVADSLENAARLAIADLEGAEITLKVYDTGGNPARAADQAVLAVQEGAQIILGPLFAEATNAAAIATSGSGVNILSFSNNTTIAGGNVYLLGNTFDDTARRLASYMSTRGVSRYVAVHSEAPAGTVGEAAIERAVQGAGGLVVARVSYPFSQQGVASAASRVASAVKDTGAEAIFTTADADSDLPFILSSLPEAGVDPKQTQYLGLTRWTASTQILDLPGAEGGIFALPDRQRSAAWIGRYAATYGNAPHSLAGLAYDGIAAVGALARSGRPDALGRAGLTQSQGFSGVNGVFRLFPDGTNQRGLAVAQIREKQVIILDPAPVSFGGAGF
ncbi:amino acid/amide ABC transporter substrate-binding protein, HAAT family [Poseidonocella pacifica]|uniref:Amino acid/amide ABC transporter substrate-binding protein, HAAT family n=1 Tax=Poseidonocella pacifica TaxID=871651 RepID=A0A1I0YYC4_9RHOB|nr:penicillin-binding protein activator [Poseidonocella pacifica]SFB18281.1 amino acid/amide ABC transporter substrate-binding protein, HAAT family [Poseidonocella pacifica]